MKLTIPQQNIWNLQKYYDDTAIANQCGAIIYREKKDIELLKNAIAMVIHSQSGLRLRFTEEEEVSQYLADETELTIPVNNFSSEAELDAYATEQAGNPIGLTDRAMYRFEIFTIGEKTGILATLSHLISDAWTFSILANEVDKAYRICEGGEGLTLSGADYFDYVQAENAYFSSEKQEKDRLFWSEKYQNRPQETPIKLNTSSSDSIKAKRVTKILPASLTIQLEAFCKEYSLTPAVVFETALISYLYRLNTENDTVTIGVPVLNRSTLKEKKTAGMFISTMPLTVFVKEDMNVTELAKQIVKEHRDIFRHRKYPYSDILKSLREKQNFTGNLYDVMMSYQNAKTETVADTKWYSNGASEVPFVIHIDNRDEKDGYTINVDYQTTVFKEEKEVLYIIERLEYILNQIIENSTQTLKELCIVPQPELIQVLEKFNDTYIEYPREKCVHELFTEQAERTPDKTALVFEDKIFTYKQLDEMSASLAHFLREKGIKPNDIVPIISKRSWHVIVAMLGVLKAGGAYMPVSPDFPKDRMQYMFETANATMALTYGYQGDLEIDTIDLSEVDYTKNPSALENVNTPDDLCYVIFTSGSTGKPKAIAIKHLNLRNFINSDTKNDYQYTMLANCNTVLADTAYTFDISVFEIYLTLLNGLTLVMTKDMASALEISVLIKKYHIDCIHTTPTKMRMFLSDKNFQNALADIKMLMIGAETFTEELYSMISSCSNAIIYNGYGPTETTIGCSFKRLNHKEKCIHEFFTEQAERTPDKTALVFEDKIFTYKQLDEMSASLAHFLREKGIKPNDIVPIISKRSWYVIVAMLGVLKAGGAYMPVSPDFPKDRMQYMFETANATMALTYGYQGDLEIDTIDLSEVDYTKNPSALENVNTPDDLCYVIFTSGSTGKPKGVSIRHFNAANYCMDSDNNVCHKIIQEGNHSIVSVTNIVFDIFVTESILALLNGITIYFANDEEVISQKKLAGLITKHSIDVIQTTPTKMKSYILDKQNLEYLQTLKIIILGGEALPFELYQELTEYTHAKIFNIYGPAETTVWSTIQEIQTYESNISGKRHEQYASVCELIKNQAIQYPENIALINRGKAFTYRQVDEKSDALAQKLIHLGVTKGDVVGAYLDRTEYVIFSQLAVLKAGGVFLPIDHRYPKDRIDFMLEDCDVKILLTDREQENKWNVKCFNVVSYDFKDILTTSVKYSPDMPCYIIYTSGSTGKPKGCVLLNKGVMNFCMNNNILSYAKELSHRTTISVNTISFDFFIAESLLPLVNGWTVVLATEEESSNKQQFQTLVEQTKANIIETTPTRLEIYTKNESISSYFHQFEMVVSSGEALSEQLYELLKRISPAKIFNPLGPSECSVWNLGGEMATADITIGKPIANTQIYIIDKHQKLLPIGVAGELCIAGDGVGAGYLNRPDLTAEKFVPNPFATKENHHGKVMYHTGDLARWRADGEIEYLGRIDTQVKIRGLRIELGEIESVMSSYPGIEMTAVTDKRDENGRQYLVGYYTSKVNIEEKDLRCFLSAKLPKYMVPNYFMHLDFMPMTASGKTERKSLPAPDFSKQTNRYTYVSPKTETEKQLAKIWSELLEVEQIGRDDDFFELGGDSLLAIHFVSKIANIFRVELSVKDVLENTTLEKISAVIDHSGGNYVSMKRHLTDRYELLPQQKAIYAACKKQPESLMYNMPIKMELPESIDRERLKAAILTVSEKHRSLKSYLMEKNGTFYAAFDKNAEITYEEYTDENTQDFVRPFDLSKAPLVRIGFTEHALLFDMHHIITDGHSLSIILQEIVTSYSGITLSKPQIDYPDYAMNFKEMDFTEHRAFFKKLLKCDFEPVLLPEKKTGQSAGGASAYFTIPKETMDIIHQSEKQFGITDTMFFLGVYGILLAKYTAKEEVLTSMVCTNRTHAELSEVVGMFVNTLPLCLCTNGNLEDYFKRVKQAVLGIYQYQELPFSCIADEIGLTDKNIINTSFVYQAEGEKTLELEGQTLHAEVLDTHSCKFDLTMEVTPSGDECLVHFEYSLGKYNDDLIKRLFNALLRIILQLDTTDISDIDVLSEFEQKQILYAFLGGEIYYDKNTSVWEIIKQQAANHPERIALISRGKEFTYRQIDEKSDALAQKLINFGVTKGDVIGAYLDRTEHVIFAQLAVLKAGGVFLPIDHRYPKDRIDFMLEDCQVRFVLSDENLSGQWNVSYLNLLDYDFEDSLVNAVTVEPTAPCYIIYTSGSTGKPKGCVLLQQGITNFCQNNNILPYAEQLGHQTVISVNTISFDFFIAESLLPLVNGWTVVLATEEESSNKQQFQTLVEQTKANIIETTPTRLEIYTKNEGIGSYFHQFEMVVSSGEALSEQLYELLKRISPAKIFNPLGPSECSVWNLGGEMATADITIGKPIANTQIYIIDKHQKLLPIGVAGELCIAGDGVGAGYLNRPDLTAEKFVPNPFATKENHHGKVMYHTGDLARWREDGEIEYLGRIDTQVKIRGLRIELGEIESVMSSYPGIEMTAVTDKRAENGRQYLVGYYTSKEIINEKELKNLLSSKLPKYMVPNYLMHLETIPMTASGKTDRKNLPTPEYGNLSATAYVPPVTELQKTLCAVLCRLFEVERFSIEDDFFDMGGDSLRAIEYTAAAHEEGVEFSLQRVFDYPTVKSLSIYLESGKKDTVTYHAKDFEKYNPVLKTNIIDEKFKPLKTSLGNVLLTGATGFLGAHILDSLMQMESGKIYCLVRSSDEVSAYKKLEQMLIYYFSKKYNKDLRKRIIVITGDIEKENLSEQMPTDIQTVIHTAASVKHYGSYEYFDRINAKGTAHVVAFAKKVHAKLIHISTLSVSGNSMADEFSVYRASEEKHFSETSFFIDQPLDNVYIHSKFEAERAVYDAMLEGLDAKVVRVGNLTNRASDYKFQPNYRENAFLTRVKALLEFGMFPDYLLPLYAEFSPIDLTAKGIVLIAEYAKEQTVFHLNSNRPLYFDRMMELLPTLGIPMQIVNATEFNRALEQTLQNTSMKYIYEALQNDMDEDGKLVYDSNIRIENEFTLWFMKQVGFEWNEIDVTYLKGYLEYFRDLGYLEV